MSTLPPLGGSNGATVSKTGLEISTTNGSRRPRTGRQRTAQGMKNSVGNSRELFDSLQRSRQVESELRAQIQKLREESRTLRTRLDDLRKAKMQTIVKREQVEDDGQRREGACKCETLVEDMRRKLRNREEEWRRRTEDMERLHQEEVSSVRLEARRARPKTASRELLEVAQAEVTRLRGIVADLQAKLRCQPKPADEPFTSMKNEVARHLNDLAGQVQQEEKKFKEREILLREELEARCKASHQLWMADAKEALTMLSRENKELKQCVEKQRKQLGQLGVLIVVHEQSEG
eukprot:scpid46518/ scgid17619/ 